MAEKSAMDCPKCGAPLEANEVQSGTVVHFCPHCFGSFYSKGELAVRLDLAAPKTGEAKCPRCRKAMDKGGIYDGRIELDRCLACGGFWFDAGEINVLRRLSGLSQLVKTAAQPDAPLPAPLSAASAVPAAKPDQQAAPPQPQKPVEPPEILMVPKGAGTDFGIPLAGVRHAGLDFDHFQTSIPVTTYVLGEFPWVATVGDTVRMSDFVRPPRLLSEESTKDESVWTLGEYIEPGEVWDAFKLPGAPPARHGVAAAQPNPWTDVVGGMRTAFFAAAAACVLSYAAVSSVSLNRGVLDASFRFALQDPEKSRVTEAFELGGRTSNVEIILHTNLDNRWAEFQMTLIEEESGKAYDFGREVSYYHGYEGGESWSEGSPKSRVYVPRVPPGRYYLRVEPETDAPALDLQLQVYRDVPLARLPLLALVLLGLPFAFVLWQARTFESARWMQSDHAPASAEEDDE